MLLLSKMTRLFALLLLGIAGCIPIAAAKGEDLLKLSCRYETEGAGVRLAILRVDNAREWMHPLQRWFGPGESMSPYIADMIPCKRLACKTEYAVRVSVNVARAKHLDRNEPIDAEERLKYRVRTLLRPADSTGQVQAVPIDPRDPRTILESMQIKRFGGVIWARLDHRFRDGSPAGAIYWRIVGGDMTASASYWLEPLSLPKDFVVESFDKAFETFVMNIQVEPNQK
jgi:hypothetical protein